LAIDNRRGSMAGGSGYVSRNAQIVRALPMRPTGTPAMEPRLLWNSSRIYVNLPIKSHEQAERSRRSRANTGDAGRNPRDVQTGQRRRWFATNRIL